MTPEFLDNLQKKFPYHYALYKVQRLNEMACMWKRKKFEPYTVRLLAMLFVENGRLDPTIRGDHGYAIGITQEHICNRGLNLYYLKAGDKVKRYCHWADGDGDGRYELAPWQQVERDFPHFVNDWTVQFFYYSRFISPFIDDGYTASDIVRLWNSREAYRQAKVDKHEPFVKAALNMQ